ncbi:ferredoxin-type protein NapF [Cognatazoarcus halotolerans]|uniref:ferredoxin-type protein NapF n=1 Tax=Cognatazoarcus halotolerans TaxID=2686016 RepID=UPI002E0D6903|nr:ferredoxin-type protein NapF [Cognatazoarcus halotolerans]
MGTFLTLARRAFLRGRTLQQALRPPGALSESEFIERCTRCDDCLKACPSGVIVRGHGGFPELSFKSGECTFCAECIKACRPAALASQDAPASLPYRARIADSCIAFQGIECRVCGERCPSAAIRFRPRVGGAAFPELIADRCTGCGACEAPCPAGAISVCPSMEQSTCE